MLDISCGECGAHICNYQKDGPGALRRMYLDRIMNTHASLERKDFRCRCKHLLGVKMMYEKEKRPAFRLFVDAVSKKIIRM